MTDKKKIEWKIVQGYYLLGGGQEEFSYEFKVSKGHPDFELIKVDSVCWTFYQAEDILTPIPAIIRVNRVFSEQNAVRLKLQKEAKQGYPILPIIKLIEEFDMELLGYMYSAHSRFQRELNSLSGSGTSENDWSKVALPEGKFKVYYDIHRMYKSGKNISAISRDKGISRQTVRRYLKMNVHEFLEYVAGSSIKVHQHEILEYLYEDHTVSTNRLYKIMKEKYKEELKISKRQFERYIKKLREEYKINRN